MKLRWGPTPYRRDNYDEIADVPGVGRYRVRRIRLRNGFNQFVAFFNGERIRGGSDIADAKAIAEAHAAERGAP